MLAKSERDMPGQADLSLLVDEYLTMAAEADGHEGIMRSLHRWGDWTPEAVAVLVELANDYGSFMLRNAAALAIALDIEDGRLGY